MQTNLLNHYDQCKLYFFKKGINSDGQIVRRKKILLPVKHLPESTPQIRAVLSAEAVPIRGLPSFETQISQMPSRCP